MIKNAFTCVHFDDTESHIHCDLYDLLDIQQFKINLMQTDQSIKFLFFNFAYCENNGD